MGRLRGVLLAVLLAAVAVATRDGDHHGGVWSWACGYAAYQGDSEVVHALLDAGCNPDFQDSEGVSALHWAALQGSQEIVTMLVEAEARELFHQISLVSPLFSARVTLADRATALGGRRCDLPSSPQGVASQKCSET